MWIHTNDSDVELADNCYYDRTNIIIIIREDGYDKDCLFLLWF